MRVGVVYSLVDHTNIRIECGLWRNIMDTNETVTTATPTKKSKKQTAEERAVALTAKAAEFSRKAKEADEKAQAAIAAQKKRDEADKKNDDPVMAIISRREFASDVIKLANQHTEGLEVDVTSSVIDSYKSNNVLPGRSPEALAEAVSILETEAVAVRAIHGSAYSSMLNVGMILLDAKRRVGHGEWMYYVQNRVGMSQDKSERLMNMARAVLLHPKLAAVANNIPDTALAVVGSNRGITDDNINWIAEQAGERELKVTDVTDLVRKKESRSSEPEPLPFTIVEKSQAAFYIGVIENSLKEFNKNIDLAKIAPWRKHARYRDYLKRITSDAKDSTDLMKQINTLLVLCWTLEESLYAPITEDTAPQQDPNIPAEVTVIPQGTQEEDGNPESVNGETEPTTEQ